MLLGLYVDDVLIALYDKEELCDVKLELEERFIIKVLGIVKKGSWYRSARDLANLFFLSQQSMICDALRAFNFEHVRAVTTPMDPNTDYNGTDSEELVDLHRVREATGTLLWIANSTHPGIAYATNFASRHREKPRKCHWELITRIIRYLKGTSDRGLRYWKESEAVPVENIEVNIWSDADWAGDRIRPKINEWRLP